MEDDYLEDFVDFIDFYDEKGYSEPTFSED